MNLKEYFDNSPRGTAKELAAELKISKSYMAQLASGEAPISTKRAVQIERLTQKKVTRQDLFADWADHWPELAQIN